LYRARQQCCCGKGQCRRRRKFAELREEGEELIEESKLVGKVMGERERLSSVGCLVVLEEK
jgi:hypothetical protein